MHEVSYKICRDKPFPKGTILGCFMHVVLCRASEISILHIANLFFSEIFFFSIRLILIMYSYSHALLLWYYSPSGLFHSFRAEEIKNVEFLQAQRAFSTYKSRRYRVRDLMFYGCLNYKPAMRLWYFSSTVKSFFKHACEAFQWG